MVNLTPEEKSGIYEEEKARIEGQAQIPYERSEQKEKSGLRDCLCIPLLLIGIVIVWLIHTATDYISHPSEFHAHPRHYLKALRSLVLPLMMRKS